MHGNVEPGAPGVIHLQVLSLDTAHFEPGQSLIYADAMLHVNDIVIGVDIGEEQFGRHS